MLVSVLSIFAISIITPVEAGHHDKHISIWCRLLSPNSCISFQGLCCDPLNWDPTFPPPPVYRVHSADIFIFPSPTQPDTVPLLRFVHYYDNDVKNQPERFLFTINPHLLTNKNDGYYFSGIAGYVWPNQPPAPPEAVPLHHYYNPVFKDHAYTGTRADDLWRVTGHEYQGREGWGIPAETDNMFHRSHMSLFYTYVINHGQHFFSSIHFDHEISMFAIPIWFKTYWDCVSRSPFYTCTHPYFGPHPGYP